MHKTLFYTRNCTYRRERLYTPDDDFLDLDFSEVASDTLVMVLHGLEGSSRSNYVQSLIHVLNKNNIAAVAYNARGCSGEINKKEYAYHSGKTDDVDTAIAHITSNYDYKYLLLVGFSMGGNMAIKYIGERTDIHPKIKAVAGISVPCDLAGASEVLAKPHNRVYMWRFLRTLRAKAIANLKRFPDSPIVKDQILKAKNFDDFDNAVTARLFGYKNAQDYWVQNSSNNVLDQLKRPVLLLNAQDDSFLSDSCYPIEAAKNNAMLSLEMPTFGGHVGFNSGIFESNRYWIEHRILAFIQSNI